MPLVISRTVGRTGTYFNFLDLYQEINLKRLTTKKYSSCHLDVQITHLCNNDSQQKCFVPVLYSVIEQENRLEM